MKRLPLLLTALATISSINAQKHPNVILIVTDDQGYGDLGITGNPHVKTPNIDKFARESVRFNNFYVSPVSAPTRSSLLTGRYSMRTGVRDTNNGGAIMASSEVTIAEMLRQQGYTTGIFGKWHLGDNYPFRPSDQGFDESLVHLSGGMAQPGDITTFLRGDSAYFDPILWHNNKQEKYSGYCSDIYAENAVNFISKHREKPFFCYLAFNAPHTPLQVPEKYYEFYKNIDPSSGFPESTKPEMNEKNKEDARKVYAMVSNIDDNVGKLLLKVDELGISENTIVIFMTDNGPEQRRYLAGLRGLKTSVYRGGVRVPFYIRYPHAAMKNRDVESVAAHIDVLPTIAELCSASIPGDRKIDGRSLVPYIMGKQKAVDERALFFYWTRRNPEKYNNIALMKGNYRLVAQKVNHDAEVESFQLYNIASDPGEQKNLIAEMPGKAVALKKELDSILNELTASENMLNPPVIELGTEHENPAILNRNDAGGERGIWVEEDVHGTWHVNFEEGYYNLKFRFIKPIPAEGRMMLDLQSISIQRGYSAGGLELEMKNVFIPGGKCDFYPFYEVGSRRILPLWVEVRRQSAGVRE